MYIFCEFYYKSNSSVGFILFCKLRILPCVKISVVLQLPCPGSAGLYLRATPASGKWVVQECLLKKTLWRSFNWIVLSMLRPVSHRIGLTMGCAGKSCSNYKIFKHKIKGEKNLIWIFSVIVNYWLLAIGYWLLDSDFSYPTRRRKGAKIFFRLTDL